MATNARYRNGHRRRSIRSRVLAEETLCALCGGPVDKTLGFVAGEHGPRCPGECAGCVPHPRRAEVDENVPVSRGGSPIDRGNVALMHRECNRWKGDRTLEEALVAMAQSPAATPPRTPIVPSVGW